jgi:hypothetical protein
LIALCNRVDGIADHHTLQVNVQNISKARTLHSNGAHKTHVLSHCGEVVAWGTWLAQHSSQRLQMFLLLPAAVWILQLVITHSK